MVRPVDGAAELAEFLADERRNAVVLGPGGGVGAAMREQVVAALGSEAAVVLDADALTSFAGDPAGLLAMIGKRGGRDVVLTPHEGEFARLFNVISEDTKVKDKLAESAPSGPMPAARSCCSRAPIPSWRRPDGRAAIADNAPPWLATAGSGDVLAGLVAGLLAQGMPASRRPAPPSGCTARRRRPGPGPDRRGPQRGAAAVYARSVRPTGPLKAIANRRSEGHFDGVREFDVI